MTIPKDFDEMSPSELSAYRGTTYYCMMLISGRPRQILESPTQELLQAKVRRYEMRNPTATFTKIKTGRAV